MRKIQALLLMLAVSVSGLTLAPQPARAGSGDFILGWSAAALCAAGYVKGRSKWGPTKWLTYGLGIPCGILGVVGAIDARAETPAQKTEMHKLLLDTLGIKADSAKGMKIRDDIEEGLSISEILERHEPDSKKREIAREKLLPKREIPADQRQEGEPMKKASLEDVLKAG